MKQKRWATLKWFFGWPGILIPLVYTALCYYSFTINKKEVQIGLIYGIISIIFLPTVFIGIGNAIIAYKSRGGVRSIRRLSTNLIVRNVWLVMCWSAGIDLLLQTMHLEHIFDLSKQAAAIKNNILICATFLGMCLYMVAIFRTYRDEFLKRLKA
ncbi:MAG: hypothetical protein ABIN91_07530 [Mucilaginibacter sp.]|uniref:hypothetical protein n=1 Tax=Mucilaginibacter sp. TaxID=1882438 RepID=UPI0032665C16